MPQSSLSDRPPWLSSLTVPLPAADRFYTASPILGFVRTSAGDAIGPHSRQTHQALLATRWCCRASETSLNRDRRPSSCGMPNRFRVCA
jgi:hypothetical protein